MTAHRTAIALGLIGLLSACAQAPITQSWTQFGQSVKTALDAQTLPTAPQATPGWVSAGELPAANTSSGAAANTGTTPNASPSGLMK